MIGIANCKGVGQRVVKGDVASDQVRHRGRSFVRNPLIVLALIPRPVCRRPVMRQVLDELQPQIRGSRMERQ